MKSSWSILIMTMEVLLILKLWSFLLLLPSRMAVMHSTPNWQGKSVVRHPRDSVWTFVNISSFSESSQWTPRTKSRENNQSKRKCCNCQFLYLKHSWDVIAQWCRSCALYNLSNVANFWRNLQIPLPNPPCHRFRIFDSTGLNSKLKITLCIFVLHCRNVGWCCNRGKVCDLETIMCTYNKNQYIPKRHRANPGAIQ